MGPGPRRKGKKALAATDSAACVPPDGFSLVPNGTKTGDMLFWDKDAGKYKPLPYPTDPKGDPLLAGVDGPYWGKPPAGLAAPKNGDKPPAV